MRSTVATALCIRLELQLLPRLNWTEWRARRSRRQTSSVAHSNGDVDTDHAFVAIFILFRFFSLAAWLVSSSMDGQSLLWPMSNNDIGDNEKMCLPFLSAFFSCFASCYVTLLICELLSSIYRAHKKHVNSMCDAQAKHAASPNAICEPMLTFMQIHSHY